MIKTDDTLFWPLNKHDTAEIEKEQRDATWNIARTIVLPKPRLEPFLAATRLRWRTKQRRARFDQPLEVVVSSAPGL
jgi:hypothetical protein